VDPSSRALEEKRRRRTAQGSCAWGENPTSAFTGALGHRQGQDRPNGQAAIMLQRRRLATMQVSEPVR
jgi:hypothetical protein